MTRAWLALALAVIASVASATDVRMGPQGPGFYRMRMGGDEVTALLDGTQRRRTGWCSSIPATATSGCL
jgi:hypothetical protein